MTAVAIHNRIEVPERRGLATKVPFEFIGQARAFRSHIADAYVEAAHGATRLLAPLRPRQGWTPMPRHSLLRQVAHDWGRLPAFGRLGLVAEFKDGKLHITELRVAPARMKFLDWGDGEAELAVSIRLTTVISEPPLFWSKATLLADVGFHALARRYQRGDGRDDAAVLRDLKPLAFHHRSEPRLGDEFEIQVSGGAVAR